MDYDEFKDELYKKWQKSLLTVCWYGALVVLIAEIAVFFLFLFEESISEVSILQYILVRICLPSFLNFFSVVFFSLSLKSNRYSINQKNYIASFSVFVISSVVSIFHNYFSFLLVASGLPIIMCAVFANKRLLKNFLILCLLSFAFSVYIMTFNRNIYSIVDFCVIVICALIFIIFIYGVADFIVTSQSEQIKFIYDASKKQVELIQELKIEPLTSLYNRKALTGALKSLVRKFNDGEVEPSLVVIDIDHFKHVNDQFGHANGDLVLIELANIIKKRMGGIRHSFRYGGEEFVLLFETKPLNEVVQIVDLIREDFSKKHYDFSPELIITISAGISKLCKNWDELIWFNSADSAMYSAKASGRNCIVY